jgi:hypothetical protein
VIYSCGIFYCYDLARQLNADCQDVWLQVTWGRIGCVALFTIVQGFGLFAPNIFAKYKVTRPTVTKTKSTGEASGDH